MSDDAKKTTEATSAPKPQPQRKKATERKWNREGTGMGPKLQSTPKADGNE